MKVAIIAALIFSTTDSLKWIVNTNPIMFGDYVSLVCMVTENTCPEDYVRRWVGGPGQNLISLNYKSSDTQKYQMSQIHNSTSFELIIYNFNEIDLECEYTCSCGFEQFTKTLSLFDNNLEFIYPLENWIMNLTAVSLYSKLNLHVSIEKVYPTPRCRVKVNDIVTVPYMMFILNYTMDQLLPTAAYTESTPVNDSVCSALLLVECWNQPNATFLSVAQVTLKLTENCNFSDSWHSWLPLTIAVTVVCCTISLVLFAIYIFQVHYVKGKKLPRTGSYVAQEVDTLL